MKILVLNAGSSSIKYQLFDFPEKRVLVTGLVERIGEPKGQIKQKFHDSKDTIREHIEASNHQTALEKVASLLLDGKKPTIRNPEEIQAVGHRVVHGGEKFSAPTLIDSQDLLDELQKLSYLAPLHNPANIMGIQVSMQVFPNAKQVAVFDTAFHQSLPPHVYRYAVPNALYTNNGVRAYGFHGTSHQYVAREGALFLGINPAKFNAITIHLGNGCSITAIKEGKSIDTSMGLTPMGGLVMGSRPGDFDPSLILFLKTHLKMSTEEIDNLLNRKSGLKGLTGENDLREILIRYEDNDPEAQLAIHMYIYRIKKYIGGYAAVLNHVDAIIFTAGVGENSAFIRERVCANLDLLGVKTDPVRNSALDTGIREFQAMFSRIKLLVVPTNEELEIANEAVRILT